MRHRWLSLLILGAVTLSTLSFHPVSTHSASHSTINHQLTQSRQSSTIRIQQANPVVNEQRQLTLTATDTGGQPVTGVTWESGSPDIATVDPNTGVVSGIQRGFATITARRGSDSISVFVVVVRVADAQGAKVPGDTKTDTAGHLYISDPLGNVIFRKENLAMLASIFAGQRGAGARIDGNRLQARFAGPTAVTVNNSADGGIFVADTLNHSLRQIDFDDNVTTILGTGSPGRMPNDVTPFAQAVFNGLRGVVTDSGGNLFVADTDNHAIYQVDFESKQIILLAGQPGTSGIVDGRGRTARFNRPSGLALSSDGKLLIVADTGNNRVRLVARNGTVATLGRKSSARGVLESSASPSFLRPEEHQLLIRRLAAIPAQNENELAFMAPQSVSADAVGNIYVVDQTGASVITRAFGDLPQKVQLAQDGSFQQAASVQVRGTESFVLDTQAQAETNALKVVSIGAPLIQSLSRTSDTLNGGSEVIINGKNFAPESVVILGDRVILDAQVLSATQIRFRVPSQNAPGNRTLSIQTRGGVAQSSFGIMAKSLDSIAKGDITTVVGGVAFIGDGGLAVNASLNLNAFGGGVVEIDGEGNLLIADSGNHRIRQINEAGIITTVAGSGNPSLSGDGGPALGAGINFPMSATIDGQGNIIIADSSNNCVRRVDAVTGLMSTIAGTGDYDFSGDDGPATQAAIAQPTSVAVDSEGSIFIVDSGNNRIRRIDPQTGIISTAVGTGDFGFDGDGGPADQAQLALLFAGAIRIADDDDLLIADTFNNRIRRVDSDTDIITTVAGIGPTGSFNGTFDGDDGPATKAALNVPIALALDEDQNLFLADLGNNRVRRVDAETGIITTVAGNGENSGGDGGPALDAGLVPCGVVIDGFGNLYISDDGQNLLRKVEAETGIITTIGGGGGNLGDNGPAATANLSLQDTSGIALDQQGNIYFADDGNHRIRKVDIQTGIITTVAGNGRNGYSGDGGPAIQASLNDPSGMAVDQAGNILIADSSNSVIRRVDARTGIITTVAGNGGFDFDGDGGPALEATLNFPTDVEADQLGNIYVADSNNNRVRKVDARTGLMTTVVGSGPAGEPVSSGDGGLATQARLQYPRSVLIDREGNLFVADREAGRIRRVDASTGIIRTVAGGGDDDADNVPATEAQLFGPHRMAMDGAGNLFISEAYASRIRRVDAQTGLVSSFSGFGIPGYSGDEGPADQAMLASPQGVAIDKLGNVVILDTGNNAIRTVKEGAAPAGGGGNPDTQNPTVTSLTLSKTKVKRKKDASLGISWASADNTGVTGHDLSFAGDGTTFSTTIISGLPGTAQSFTWTVPTSVAKTKSGRVQVTARDAAGNLGTAASGTVIIK